MDIENKDTFLSALRDGINLFLGAGFSLLAQDSKGRSLPLGSALAEELATHFSFNPGSLSLSQICTIIESRHRAALREFLVERHTVVAYDPRYSVLERLNIKTIFTTNIDDLLFKVFANSRSRYLNDLDLHGPAFKDKAAIDLVTLHGCILDTKRPLRFSDADLASAFGSDPDRWHFFTSRLQQYPTLFWGYGLTDAGALQSLSGETIRGRQHSDKWIALLPVSEQPSTVDYFKALDFQIVLGDTSELLNFLIAADIPPPSATPPEATASVEELFTHEAIPKLGSVPVRSLLDFFLGAPPQWSDIFSGNLYRTHHSASIRNAINGNKHVMITGAPLCGKSTLLRQAAIDGTGGFKLFCDKLTVERAHFLANRLAGLHTLVFIDNCTDSIGAIDHLINLPNIQVVGADRDYNLQIVSHRVRLSQFVIIDVTELSDNDIQKCLESIPATLRRPNFQVPDIGYGLSPTLFDLLESNLREPTLRHRFGTVLKELREKNKVLVDMLLMFAYVYQCRTPVSMDMLIAFLRDFTTDYREVYILRRQLGEMVADYLGPLADEEQDYFVTRSESLARAILENGKLEEIKHMLLKFHDQISPRRICHYDVFRRRAYDADIAMMAFADVEEGQDFYERMYQRDQSPYLLQQGALFLSRKQCYQEAFALIDEAILASGGKILSIRNSHAIILFRANIVFANDPEARGTLKRSMEILSECYSSDKRKMYHALAYSDQALQYARACPHDSYAMEFLRTAQKWLVEEEKYSPWSREIKRLRPMVERQLASLGG